MDGLEGYPFIPAGVSDVLSCQKKTGGANLIYPQFATHNAHTLAAIYQLAGQATTPVGSECLYVWATAV